MPLSTSSRLVRVFSECLSFGEFGDRYGVAATLGGVTQFLDAVSGLPEEQIGRDCCPQHRDEKPEVGPVELEVWQHRADGNGAPRDVDDEKDGHVAQEREAKELEHPGDRLERAEYHEGSYDESASDSPHRRQAEVQQVHAGTYRDEVSSDVQCVRDDERRYQHDNQHSPSTGEPARDQLPEALAGRKRGPVADLLHSAHEREADERNPEHPEPIFGSHLRVGCDARRVVIGRAGDQARSERSHTSPPR